MNSQVFSKRRKKVFNRSVQNFTSVLDLWKKGKRPYLPNKKLLRLHILQCEHQPENIPVEFTHWLLLLQEKRLHMFHKLKTSFVRPSFAKITDFWFKIRDLTL